MRRILVFTLCLTVAGPFVARALGQAHDDALAPVAWLAGCWRLDAGTRTTDEVWMAPRGSLMMGMSRTVRDGAVRETERVQLRAEGGEVLYVAFPSNQEEATFRATHVSDTLLVFENPEHDFPQRIRYTRTGEASFVARIEGDRGGQLRGVDFPMQRVRCEVGR